MHVLHRCDNPSCVNPDHLYLGTHLDNMADRTAKGRNNPQREEKHPMAKLNKEQVSIIKQQICNGESHRSIAELFDVSKSLISHIATGRLWKYIAANEIERLPI